MGFPWKIRLIVIAVLTASMYAVHLIFPAPFNSYTDFFAFWIFTALLMLALGYFLGIGLLIVSIGLIAGAIFLPVRVRVLIGEFLTWGSDPRSVSMSLIINGVLGVVYSSFLSPFIMLDLLGQLSGPPKLLSNPAFRNTSKTSSSQLPKESVPARLQKKVTKRESALRRAEKRLRRLERSQDEEGKSAWHAASGDMDVSRYQNLKSQVADAKRDVSSCERNLADARRDFNKA